MKANTLIFIVDDEPTARNLALTAKKLEISRATLYRKIDKYELRKLSPFLREIQETMEI